MPYEKRYNFRKFTPPLIPSCKNCKHLGWWKEEGYRYCPIADALMTYENKSCNICDKWDQKTKV